MWPWVVMGRELWRMLCSVIPRQEQSSCMVFFLDVGLGHECILGFLRQFSFVAQAGLELAM